MVVHAQAEQQHELLRADPVAVTLAPAGATKLEALGDRFGPRRVFAAGLAVFGR